MGWLRDKLFMVWTILRLIDIEPYVVLYVMTGTSDVSRTQMMQDKICINHYNQTREYCIELSKTEGKSDSEDSDPIANKILGDVSQYLTYNTMLSSLPAIFFILFVASWIDSYVHGRKIVMCLGGLGSASNYLLLWLNAYYFDWDVKYTLLSIIPSSLIGGWSCVWMGVYSFMANNSSKENRFLKFTSFEIATFIGRPLGTYINGVLLGSGNYHSDGNIHYYERTSIFFFIISLMAFFYVLFAINENKPKKKTYKDNDQNEINESGKQKSEEPKEISLKFEFSKIVNYKNFKDIIKTAIKVRPHKGRAKIWLLYLAMCVTMLSDARFFSNLFLYTERVYEWDATMFSNVKSLASITQTIVMPMASGVLSGYLKLSDSILGIIGFIDTALMNICIGSILEPLGLYLLFIIGSIASIAPLAIRSLLSKIAPETESGKIFALLAALEMVFKAVEDLVLNSIFKFSIDWFPSLIFQTATAFNFISLFIFYWIDLTHNPIEHNIK